MISQGANQSCINKQLFKSLQRCLGILKEYGWGYNELLQKLKNCLSWSNRCFLFTRFLLFLTPIIIVYKDFSYCVTFVHDIYNLNKRQVEPDRFCWKARDAKIV